ncbi:Delta-sterol reductase [Golovinomyces cichoracearum]|uniref:Delta(24(24(1)))-sterol reductase n=1 Tax=Golovinomyces cichoracearum TaxID=62708 RepID=A0A420JB57_9PEZI|nr:Delta-sterol reductase [Golovinomyces cichoracearum]
MKSDDYSLPAASAITTTSTCTSRRLPNNSTEIIISENLTPDTGHETLKDLKTCNSDIKNEVLSSYERYLHEGEIETDPENYYTRRLEFGGSIGVSIMMLSFPMLIYYMWIGATFYDGKFPTRTAGQNYLQLLQHFGSLIYQHAFPGLHAWKIFGVFFLFEAVCYCLLPGVYTYGKPLVHIGGKKMRYYCSGIWSFYFTILVMGFLHYTRIFKLYTLIDQLGPIISVMICSSFGISIIAYFSALYRNAQYRMTGYLLYDFFMGAELNPRMFGILDLKMFFEVRLPWFILFGLSCATAARQYEKYGYISAEVSFLVMAHFLYANACAKGEELITSTWDIYYEKWGFMLIFWNMAGVPLSYCHCTIYLANHLSDLTNYPYRTFLLTILFLSYLIVYWIWDTTNSQKNHFRASERGITTRRLVFPQLPWREVKNPRIILTTTGDNILVDGWYSYARKIHYTCDLYFALTWALITGFKSPFPWFYPTFFIAMIFHRARRDTRKCRLKYGSSWTEYEKMVPWFFIPYVY